MEEWKDIYYFDYTKSEWIDYRGLYQVSNKGRIKSLNYRGKRQERILKEAYNKNGYSIISFHKDKKQQTFRIHRLVAFMFIFNDNPLIKMQVNHIDEDKTNNHVDNLEWCTNEYNTNYGTHNKRMSESKKGKKLSNEHKKKLSDLRSGNKNPISKKVICITTGEIFDYIKQAEEKYGINHSNISKCCLGKRKYAGKLNGKKLSWMYYENYLKSKGD